MILDVHGNQMEITSEDICYDVDAAIDAADIIDKETTNKTGGYFSFSGHQSNSQKEKYSYCKSELGCGDFFNFESHSFGKKSKYIKAGKSDGQYKKIQKLFNESDLLKRTAYFLASNLITDLEFFDLDGVKLEKEDGHDQIKSANNFLNNCGLSKTNQQQYLLDIFLNGYATPQLIYKYGLDGQQLIRIYRTPSCDARLGMLRESVLGFSSPQEIALSSNDFRTSTKLKAYPIIDSNVFGYGDLWRNTFAEENAFKFDPNIYLEKTSESSWKKIGEEPTRDALLKGVQGITGFYVAQVPDAVSEFLPVSYWHCDSTLNTIWSHKEISKIKAGYLKNSLMKSHIILINRNKEDGVYTKKDTKNDSLIGKGKEAVLRRYEEKKIQSIMGSKGAGGVITMWDHSGTKDAPPYLQIIPIPKIDNESFLKFLESSLENRAMFGLGVHPEILGLLESKSGFSNKSATLLFYYLIMLADVGEKLREPIRSFLNFVLSQKGIELTCDFADPKPLSYLRDIVGNNYGLEASQKIKEGAMQFNNSEMSDQLNGIQLQVDFIAENLSSIGINE